MNLKSILSIGAIAGLVAVSFACTSTSDSSGGGSTSSGVTIGGTLSGLSLMSHDKLTTFAVTDYSVKCVTFANPPIAGNGDLGADSTFSLTLDGAATTDAFGCFVLKASAVVATMVFKDSTADSMDGGKSKSCEATSSPTGS